MTPCEFVRGDFRWHGTVDPWCRIHSQHARSCMTALQGELAAVTRGRKDAEDTVEAIRADLEEERKYRDLAEVKLGGVRKEVELWASYAEEPQDSQTSMRRIEALVAPPKMERAPDPLHPTGRCRCGGEGRCAWCQAHPDPYQAEPIDAEGVVEALQETQAHIESCLAAEGQLEAVREVVEQYNHPGNEKFGSLVAMQKITTLLAASNAEPSYTREALEGTKSALRAEMLRCQAAEANLKALGEAIESTTVGEWRDMTGYKRLHALLADRAAPDGQDAPAQLEAVRRVVEQATEHASRFTGEGDDGPRGVLYAEAVGFRRIQALFTTPEELCWHCVSCGNHECTQPTDKHDDPKLCSCGKGPMRVMTLKEAAALEQAVALGRPFTGGSHG